MARMGHVRRGDCPRACKRQHHRLDANRHRAPTEFPQEAPLRAEVGDGGGLAAAHRRTPLLHPLPWQPSRLPPSDQGAFPAPSLPRSPSMSGDKVPTRDLGIGKRMRDVMRAAVLAVFALIALVVLASKFDSHVLGVSNGEGVFPARHQEVFSLSGKGVRRARIF